MRRCWIGLGGNQGDVRKNFRAALQFLNASPGTSVAAVSSAYRTAPMGSVAGCSYWNAAAELHTDLPPEDLLDLLQAAENQAGRVREAHWGPRPLDLDLLLDGEELIETPRLRVPHPHFWYRRFVLDPLAEIAPGAVHPLKNLTVQELRERLQERPLLCSLTGGTAVVRKDLIRELQPQFPVVELSGWTTGSSALRSDAALLIWLGVTEKTDSPAFSELPPLSRLDATEWNLPLPAAVAGILQAATGS